MAASINRAFENSGAFIAAPQENRYFWASASQNTFLSRRKERVARCPVTAASWPVRASQCSGLLYFTASMKFLMWSLVGLAWPKSLVALRWISGRDLIMSGDSFTKYSL